MSPDQRQDFHSRARIVSLEQRYRKVAKGLVTMTALTLVAVIVGFVMIRNVINDVQAERFRNVKALCDQTNERHDNTVKELDARLALAKLKLPPAQQKRVAESRDFTVALIDALAPTHPDCAAYARELVSK